MPDGDMLTSDCSTGDLLPLYIAGRDPLAGNDPQRDFAAMFGPYTRENPRRSRRLRVDAPASPSSHTPAQITLPSPSVPTASNSRTPRKRCRSMSPSAMLQKKQKRATEAHAAAWMDEAGTLVLPDGVWT
ncbi:hypothetical protein B0H10DRAFT_2233134 [Mycena sp. CBHHK59/15]|nr:hypothetical protein B0H10DRAFT_2233134 [Mycena sp. CBHHK59/15]